jgi:hypothetical protein
MVKIRNYCKSDAMAMPYIPSQSPMDLPVERFISALNRRETNRKAIIKWISDNFFMGTDFGRIHVVGKISAPWQKKAVFTDVIIPDTGPSRLCGNQVRKRYAVCSADCRVSQPWRI